MKTTRRNLFKYLAALPLALAATTKGNIDAQPPPAPDKPAGPVFGNFYLMLCDPNAKGSIALAKWITARHPNIVTVFDAMPSEIYWLRKSGEDVLVVTSSPIRDWYFEHAQLVFSMVEYTNNAWHCKKERDRYDVYCDKWIWQVDDENLHAAIKPTVLPSALQNHYEH